MRSILCVCLLLALTAAVSAEVTGRKWAVIIGVNRYQNPGITPLRYAEADARKLAEALVSHGGFQPKDVFVLTTDRTGYELPTRTNVAFRFDYLIKSMGPNDTLLVYFSGHGVEVEGQSFLLTTEADSRSLLTLQQSALNASDLFRWLGATRAARTLLVVDAFRNAPMAGNGDADNQLSDRMAHELTLVPRPPEPGAEVLPARATFLACSPGQRSFEWSEQGQGFFTYYLVEGLRGQAAGADGRVTLQSLTNYVQREVADASSRWLMQKQVPWLRCEGPGASGWELARGQASSLPSGTDLQREKQAREQAEQRVRQAEAARAEAEARAQKAEQARREAEERARQAEQAAVQNPQDPVLAEKVRQREAELRRAEQQARQAEAERARLGTESRLSGRGGSKPLFVSLGQQAPYSSLGAALQDAPANSVIMVTAGTYREDLLFTRPVTIDGDKSVLEGTLRAEAPVKLVNCTIRGQLVPLSNFQLVRCNLELKR